MILATVMPLCGTPCGAFTRVHERAQVCTRVHAQAYTYEKPVLAEQWQYEGACPTMRACLRYAYACS